MHLHAEQGAGRLAGSGGVGSELIVGVQPQSQGGGLVGRFHEGCRGKPQAHQGIPDVLFNLFRECRELLLGLTIALPA